MTFWNELRGQRVFLTGGTGFFGRSLLEDFAERMARDPLDVELVVLTRDAGAFRSRWPELSDIPGVSFHEGDVRDFEFPDGAFPLILHAATPTSTTLNRENPDLLKATILEGTRRVLAFASKAGTSRLLFVSSGAAYGRQPSELEMISESHPIPPVPLQSAYGEGKRLAEELSVRTAKETGLVVVIARCFAFLGPHLPLNETYAIGNFIRDSLEGGPIQVNGDGTAIRSYLDSSDLVVWLWTLLLHGQDCRIYNVGSEDPVSIADLARQIAVQVDPSIDIRVSKTPPHGQLPERYVPSTSRARLELGLSATVPLKESITRTLAWHRSQRPKS